MAIRLNSLNLYIPIEVKSRELAAKVLLATHAARCGFDVIFGRKNDLNELVVHMPAGVYLGLGVFENFCSFYARLKKLGFSVVVNEEEGLVTYADSMYVDMRLSRSTLGWVDEVLTWGLENQRVLTEAFPEFVEKFHITGNPRFDLLKPQVQRVYDEDMRAIRAKYGDYLLVCTSFSSINHFDPKLDYIKSLVEKKTLRSQASIDKFKRYRELKQKTFAAFLDAIPRLAAALPGIQIVVRPHPSENGEVYRKAIASIPNAHVDSRFSVHPWILGAHAIVHHYCTTSIEALAAGTPRFALRPVKDELCEKSIPFDCSVECSDVDQLLAHIAEYLATGSKVWQAPPLRCDYSRYVFNIGEQWAVATIADRLQGLGAAIALRNRPPISLRMQLAYWAYLLRKTVRRNDHHYLDHKFAYLSLSEVEHLLQKFDATDVEAHHFMGDFIQIRQRRE